MTKKTTKTTKSNIKLISNNNNSIINNKIIGHPNKPNNINIRILLKYFKQLLLIGNINVSLDVSKIGRRKGNEWIKRGKIATENNILNDEFYVKFYELTAHTRGRWISKTIQRLQKSNHKGSANSLQYLLEQQAPEDFKRLVQDSSDSNATQLIFALQNTTRSLPGKIEDQKSIPGNKV
tara:strand:- start:4363 stop:4899 length:537 start_codon:yes stop_codon:yes gene_type:complete